MAILAGVVAGALWLTGSRTAFLAAPAVAVIAAWARWLRGKRSRLILLGIVLSVLAGAMVAYVSYTGQRSLSEAADIRVELTRTGLRMFADHPVFGAGVGLYYSLSNTYASRELREFFPRENAHNNFLQILAELGIVGLGLFAWVIWSVGRLAWPPFISGRASAELAGSVAGLLVFLVTCLMGHPLLIREIAYAFWMMLGLAAALVPDASPVAVPAASWARLSGRRLAVPALALILAASVPARVWQAVSSPNFARTSEGLSDWQTDSEGVPFRWMDERAGLSIRGTARTVTLPLKLDASSQVPSCSVDVLVGGTFLSRVTLAGHEWQKIRLVMPPPPPGTEYWRIELRVLPARAADGASAAPPRVQVGRPTLNRQAT